MIALCRVTAQACFYFDASVSQNAQTSTVHPLIGVHRSNNHAFYTRLHQRLGTRRRFAVMGARLKRDIDIRPTRLAASLRKGDGFGMWSTTRLRPSAPNDAPGFYNHTAHSGIGRRIAHPAPTKGQRKSHIARVAFSVHSSLGASGRSSATNLSKSSAA